MQLGDEFQYLGLDMVHLRARGELDAVILDSGLLEFLEPLLNLGAVIGLAVISANRETRRFGEHAIFHCGQIGLERLRCREKGREALGIRVIRQIVAEAEKTARFQFRTGEAGDKQNDGLTIDRGRVEKPRLFLLLIMRFLHAREMLAHFAHVLGEAVYAFMQGGVFQVLHHLVTIFDGVDAMETGVKEGL